MASGTSGADGSREKSRWGENSKVYTRKIFKKRLKDGDATNSTSVVAPTTAANNYNEENNIENCKNDVTQQSLQTLSTEDADSLQQQQERNLPGLNAVLEISRPPEAAVEVENRNGIVKPVVTRIDNRIRINLAGANSKDEILELRMKLVHELEQVRSLVKQVEAKEAQLTQHLENDVPDRRALVRVNSEVGSVGYHHSRPLAPVNVPLMENYISGERRANSEVGSVVGGQRPFRHLSVSVMKNNNNVHGAAEFVEKEKRTPKANQFYMNSDFLLAKDRLPPESNKKVKSNSMDRYRKQVFKNCNSLLQRLMKHRHSWVFNEPVNTISLGLHDYHDIIRHPMDLGTVKSRLAQNAYKSPREFAEDVRLTFRNAMTYNPEGQDVHIMAEELSTIFEERWAVIEAEMLHYTGWKTPTPRKFPPPPPVYIQPMRALNGSEPMTTPINFRPKPSIGPASRTPVPKKPKAKDPNKRDMTYDEKQRLSTNLQSLPSEKLDNLVQIINKRNSAFSQRGDEIEVDIDSVDIETLWELDRFVTNYKKSLSKIKRRAELAQARAEAGQPITASKPIPAALEAPEDGKTATEMNVAAATPVEADKQGEEDSSSSSSSSDSDTSSSDSDSDSSSSSGSDADSPGTVNVD